MEVILLKELRGRGGEGDVIDVSRGFANNYLLRQGYAIKATPGNLKQLEERRKNIEKREEVRIANANELAEKLNGLTVNVTVQVGEEGQLFGSVTAPMIADAIVDMGIEIDKRRVELGKPIKMVGEFPVDVSIYRDIKATVNVVVAGEQTEADAAEQAEEAAEAAAEAVGEAVADAIEAEVEQVALAEEAAEMLDHNETASQGDVAEPSAEAQEEALEAAE